MCKCNAACHAVALRPGSWGRQTSRGLSVTQVCCCFRVFSRQQSEQHWHSDSLFRLVGAVRGLQYCPAWQTARMQPLLRLLGGLSCTCCPATFRRISAAFCAQTHQPDSTRQRLICNMQAAYLPQVHLPRRGPGAAAGPWHRGAHPAAARPRPEADWSRPEAQAACAHQEAARGEEERVGR